MTGAYWGLGVGEVGTGTKMCGGWQESARRHRNEGPGGQNHQKGLQAAPLASVRCVEGRRAPADIWTGSVSVSQDSWGCVTDHLPIVLGGPLAGWASWTQAGVGWRGRQGPCPVSCVPACEGRPIQHLLGWREATWACL